MEEVGGDQFTIDIESYSNQYCRYVEKMRDQDARSALKRSYFSDARQLRATVGSHRY